MKGPKPLPSRLKKAFITACAAIGIGAGSIGIDQLPKDPMTDTQISSYETGTLHKYGYNISPIDQMWKASLVMRSSSQLTDDFYAAARAGDSWRMQALLDAGIEKSIGNDANFQNLLNTTLTDAASSNHTDIINILLKAGADVQADDNAPLIAAVRDGKLDALALLLTAGADAKARDSAGLWIAVINKDENAVAWLLQEGADPSARHGVALRQAADMNQTALFDRMIAKTDGGAKARNSDAFLTAVLYGQTRAVDALASAGADLDANSGQALSSAVLARDIDMTRQLLDRGANPNIEGNSALTLSLTAASDQYLAALLAKGANATVNDNQALYDVVLAKDYDKATLLMRYGADASARGGDIMKAAGQDAKMKSILSGIETPPAPTQISGINPFAGRP